MPSVTSYALSVCRLWGRVRWKARGGCGGQAYRARKPCPLQESGVDVSKSSASRGRCHYLAAPLARIYYIILVAVLVEQRLGVAARRVHGGRGCWVWVLGVGAVVEKKGGAASERAGRDCGRLAVTIRVGLSCSAAQASRWR
jgi:hypothetical protein